MIECPDTIKELFQQDGVRKSIRIHFPNGEHRDLCNQDIIAEKLQFNESICSSSTLKFGLVEANLLFLTTIGVGNIKGATIEAYLVKLDVIRKVSFW